MIRYGTITTERDELHPVFGQVHVIDIQGIDEETGQSLTNQQVYEAFQAFNIIGVHVKLHHKKLFKADAKFWPGFGVITNIDSQYVWLGTYEVPKQDFLEWYELD